MQKIKYKPLSPEEKRKYTLKQTLEKVISILIVIVNIACIGFSLFMIHLLLMFDLSLPSDWTLFIGLLVKGVIGFKFGIDAFHNGISSGILEEIVTIAGLALIYFGRSIIDGVGMIKSSLMFVPIVSIIVIILLICALSYVYAKVRSKNKKNK